MVPAPASPPSRALLAAGFAAVYLIWGSTYLAIRFGVETLPPFLMAATRFVIPGAVLYVWIRRRGAPRPSAAHWRAAAVSGSLLLLGGNGVVTWAEQWVPSGLTALIIASVPLWMAAISWVVEPGARPGARGIAGIVLGFAGVAYLVNPGGDLGRDPHTLIGALSIVLASGLWAAGSLTSRHLPRPGNAFLSSAMQMLAGAAALAVAGTLAGEWGRVDLAAVSVRSAVSLLYLMTFGSVIALSAYVWLMQVSTPAKVSTYAYVNPVVAVFLGWAVAGEAVSSQTVAAAAVIIASVVMITTERRRVAAGGPPTAPPTGAVAAAAPATAAATVPARR
jgi:drug/metabolite transporter (DMT)-like permease